MNIKLRVLKEVMNHLGFDVNLFTSADLLFHTKELNDELDNYIYYDRSVATEEDIFNFAPKFDYFVLVYSKNPFNSGEASIIFC